MWQKMFRASYRKKPMTLCFSRAFFAVPTPKILRAMVE